MCGRYAQGRAIPEVLARYADLGAILVASEQLLLSGFNIRPGAYATVVYQEGNQTGIGPMRWGLLPHWAKSLDAVKVKPINARSETADTSPMFREAFRSGRCLVPATGFFEWQGKKPPKQPYFIHVADQELFSFAGLWSRWKGAGGAELLTFAILTTAANEAVQPVHDRMPCILHPEEKFQWLDSRADLAEIKGLLRPYPAGPMRLHRVSAAVNTPGRDGPELIRPIE